MSGNKFEKPHIHILEPETLSRESRVTEFAQKIVDSTRIDGCKVVSGTCPTCSVEKVWE